MAVGTAPLDSVTVPPATNMGNYVNTLSLVNPTASSVTIQINYKAIGNAVQAGQHVDYDLVCGGVAMTKNVNRTTSTVAAKYLPKQ